ncbi:MAG: serine/threonine protein kinase [Planctomycetes bacterium]|nr:serine/threonine protein kinase [Planctomycetota bacterium]
MGVVYKAQQVALKRTVALKMILAGGHADVRELARFRIEAEAVARLQHPNIVQIHEVGESGGHPYCALEFVEGGNLATRLGGNPMAARAAAKLVELLARAMQLAHSRNVVHRDLKPANILLNTDGVPKITDFGLARQLDIESGETQAGTVMGTPSYMAPEQASGLAHEAGPAADVYALGAILYECLCGRPPFKGNSIIETLDLVRNQEPTPPSRWHVSVPLDLDTICLKCLQKAPERRYASAAELADELARYQLGEPIRARPIGRVERTTKWVRRNPAIAGASAAVFLMLVAAVVVSSLFAFEANHQAKEARTSAKKADDNAEKADAKASEADKERKIALRALEDAKRLQVLASGQLDVANRRVYISDMRMAQRALESNRFGQLQGILEKHQYVPPSPDLRGWEWYYLRAEASQDLHTFPGHSSCVDVLGWNPDGTRLASGSSAEPPENALHVWNADTGREAFSCAGHRGNVTSLAWSPNGFILAVAGSQGLRLWDGKTGELLQTLEHYAGSVRALAWSPDGKWLAIGGNDNSIELWDADQQRVDRTLNGHTSPIGRLMWDAGGNRLASTSSDYTVRVWNLVTGTTEQILALDASVVPNNWILECALSPDGKYIAWEGDPDVLPVVELSSGKTIATCEGNTLGALQLEYSPNGKFLAVRQGGKTRIWDALTGGQPLLSVNCSAFAWVWNGEAIALANPTTHLVSLYKPATQQFLAVLPGHLLTIYALDWNPAKKRLASGGGDAVVKLWSLPSESEPSRAWTQLNEPIDATAIAWGRDGSQFALAQSDQTISIREAVSLKQLRTFPAHGPGITALEWSPDGKRLASTSIYGEPIIWDPDQGKPTGNLEYAGPVDRPQWSPNSRYLAARCLNKGPYTIAIWDAESHKIAKRLGDGVYSFTWSPDSQKVAWSRYSGTVIEDVATNDGVTRGFACKGADLIAWSPGGTMVAASRWNAATLTGEVEVWDPASGTDSKTLDGHSSRIAQLVWSPDSSRLLSIAETAKLWDPQTGSEILSFAIQGAPLARACWPENERILAKTPDAVHVWNAQRGYDRADPVPTNLLGIKTPARPPIDMTPIGRPGHFIRTWRFLPNAVKWNDRSQLPTLTTKQLQAIETNALASNPETSSTASIDLRQRFPETESFALGYAAQRIVAPDATRVRLLTGSDDTLRIWLNGKLVLTYPHPRTTSPDSDSLLVEFPSGVNRLLIEVGQFTGAWSFCLRLEDETGRKLELNEDDKLLPLSPPR